MPSALANNSNRKIGPTYKIEFEKRPLCKVCGRPLVIRQSSKPKTLIDLDSNVQVITKYYICNKKDCSSDKSKYLRPESPFAPPSSDYTFTVLAKICWYRWKKKETYEEIIEDMETNHNICLSLKTIETALRIYEIGCEGKYRPVYLQKFRENGGIILTIDGMAPIKGNKSLYVVYDYLTKLPLGSKRLPNQSADTIEAFLLSVKSKIEEELGVPVIGVISDALPSQRIAIERVFKGVPHCLCHYHFYNLVLKESNGEDSHIMTQIRKKLRKMNDIKKFAENNQMPNPRSASEQFIYKILSTLQALSNWKRHKDDPCFSGIILYDRIYNISQKLDMVKSYYTAPNISKELGAIFSRIHTSIREIIHEFKDSTEELFHIQDHIDQLSDILSDLDSSYNVGLKRLRKLRDKLRKHRFSPKCGEIERRFIEELMKFVRTKGPQLMNYKKVPGAPTTNNSHELQYKQLKHFLRRVIGFASAKVYLLAHGERLVFVQLDETLERILEILLMTDFTKARNIITQERKSRDSLPYLIHHKRKWEKIMEDLEILIEQLLDPSAKKT